MKAVLYLRSATDNSTWLDDQEADCRRYADMQGLTIAGTFLDIGRTGDGLNAVIDAAEHDDVGAMIVTDLARLGNRITDHLAVMQRLHDAGVDIHITKEGTTEAPRLYVMQS